MVKICTICGNEYTPRKSRYETSKYCGNDCANKGKKIAFTGNKLRAGKAPTNAYKSGENVGENHPRWVERKTFVCKFCGDTFKKEKWRTNQKDHTNEYCSVSCRTKFRKQFLSGENASDWVGGPQTYRGKSFTKSRKRVIELQHGLCAVCKTFKGDKLSVHHIRPFREFNSVDEANQLFNLVGLCQSCHMRMEHQTKKDRILLPGWLLRNSIRTDCNKKS